jgi:hypothetical protein
MSAGHAFKIIVANGCEVASLVENDVSFDGLDIAVSAQSHAASCSKGK